MLSEEIVVEGIHYVSSKRASDISGYAQDYIGQLARSNQIQATRMGGLWYVYMESLDKYKAQSPEIRAMPVTALRNNDDQDLETPLQFDGKSYISASRASKITGYNQDYVGQLARNGKVPSRQVGNRWYVDEDKILSHKKEKDSLLAALQSESVGIAHTKVLDIPENKALPPVETELLNYKSDNKDLQPIIDRKRLPEVTLRALESVIESPAFGPVDRNDIPIQIVRKPNIITKQKFQKPPVYRASFASIESKKRSLHSVTIGILIIGLTGLLAGGFLLLTKTQNANNPSLVQLGMTASVLVSNVSSNLSNVEKAFENLLDPEVIYKRSK
jgi:hypothetical protein